MRRGLIARSKVELPDAVFDARLERLRAAMHPYPSPVFAPSSGRVGWGLLQRARRPEKGPTPALPEVGEGEESLRVDRFHETDQIAQRRV